MELNLREPAHALETGSVRGMAAALDMSMSPRLSVSDLIAEFIKQATPHAPANLQIAVGSSGFLLSWSDPGAEHFYRATKFHANFWDGSVQQWGSEDLDRSTHVVGVNGAATEGHTYSLFVQSFNVVEGEERHSETRSTSVHIPSASESDGGGWGFEFDDQPDAGDGGGVHGGDGGWE